jgi:hypothetical protein
MSAPFTRLTQKIGPKGSAPSPRESQSLMLLLHHGPRLKILEQDLLMRTFHFFITPNTIGFVVAPNYAQMDLEKFLTTDLAPFAKMYFF